MEVTHHMFWTFLFVHISQGENFLTSYRRQRHTCQHVLHPHTSYTDIRVIPVSIRCIHISCTQTLEAYLLPPCTASTSLVHRHRRHTCQHVLHQQSPDTSQFSSPLDTEIKTDTCPKEAESHWEARDRGWAIWSHLRIRQAIRNQVQLPLGSPLWCKPCIGQEIVEGWPALQGGRQTH